MKKLGEMDEKELKDYCKQLYNSSLILQNKIDSLETALTKSNEEISNIPKTMNESDVESLLLRELAYVDKLSQGGGLDSDETKQLKMLVDSYVALKRKDALPKGKAKTKLPSDPKELLDIVKNATKQ